MDVDYTQLASTEAGLNKKRQQNVALYVILAILLVPVFFMGMIVAPDTDSYLFYDSQRPPLLPLLMNLDHFITGEHFLLLQLSQVGLLVAGVMCLDKWLRQTFSVSKTAVCLFVLLFFAPIIYHGHYGRMLMSEAISIPAFLLLIVALCQLFMERTLKRIMIFCGIVSVLVLTRNQFYYLYGFYPLFLLWAWFHKTPVKKMLIFTSAFAVGVLFTTFFSLCYHKVVNHHFAQTSANGPLLLVQPLYLSHKTDVQYFKTPEEKQAFLAVYQHSQAQGYLQTTQDLTHLGFTQLDLMPSYVHFVDIFNPLQFESQAVLGKLGYSLYDSDKLMTHMAGVLFFHNLKNNLLFYLWKFLYSLGGALLVIIYLVLAALAFARVVKNKHNGVAIVSLVLLALVFANNLTVALSEMILSRYLIYPGMALSIIITILFCKACAKPMMSSS